METGDLSSEHSLLLLLPLCKCASMVHDYHSWQLAAWYNLVVLAALSEDWLLPESVTGCWFVSVTVFSVWIPSQLPISSSRYSVLLDESCSCKFDSWYFYVWSDIVAHRLWLVVSKKPTNGCPSIKQDLFFFMYLPYNFLYGCTHIVAL